MRRAQWPYVEINTPVSHASGSGFLMGEDLFITNQHVIADAAAAHSAVLIFDREMDERGQPRHHDVPTRSRRLCTVLAGG